MRDVSEKDDAATATLAVAWEIPRIGRWSYRARLSAAKGEKGWVVHWSPTAVHPELDSATRLGTSVKAPARGRIDDRQGRALMAERAVTAIDVDTRRVTDPADTASRIADLIDEVDADELRKEIEAAPKGGFVPVITLRKAAYDKVAGELQDVPGASTAPGTAPLAPTKDFARALLGAVGPATAEQVERSDGRLAPGDAVGQWGLQAAFDAQLAGTETRSIVVRDAEDGVVEKTLRRWRGKQARGRRDDDRPRRPARRRAGAGDDEEEDGAGRAPAVDRERPGGRQPAVGGHARPRADRPLPARLDVQGGHDDRAPARRPVGRPDRAVPEERGRRRALVQELRGRRGRATSRSAPTSRSPATPRSSRSRRASAARP